MQGFIKNFSDFKTSKTFRAVEWDIALRSTEDEVSTVVVVAGDVEAGDVGDWLIMAGALLRIESVQTGSSVTTVKCRDIASAFAQTLLLQDLMEDETISYFIMDTIGQQFEAADDAAYAIPYLSTSATTEGDIAYRPPETDDYGRFAFDEYLRSVARVHNIHLSWAITGADTLALTVGRGDIKGGQIVLGVGSDQLADTPVFASAEVAKITALQKNTADDGTETMSKLDFYLYTDGTFGTTATGGERAEGGWDYITVSPDATEDEISEKVAQLFSRGMSDSKISFWSSRDLTVGAPVVLRVAGKKHSGYITYKGVNSSDKRYFYRCGNRPVTLTEKLKAAGKTAQTAGYAGSSTSGGGGGTGAVTSVNGKTGAVTIGAEVVSGEDVTPNSVAIKHGTAAVAELRKTDTGRGVMALRSAAHSDWAAIQAYALPEGGGGLITKNAAGNTIFTLSASISGMQEDAGGIVVGNADGTGRALIGVNTAGGGILQLRDVSGNAAILTKERIDQIGAAANGVEVKNGDTTVAYLNQTEDGRGNFQLRKADGTLGVHAYVNSGSGGEIDLRNGSGTRRAAFYVSGDDEGCLQLIDADGVAQKLTPARLAVWPSNPNLLDNWFFPNAVNQSGVTSWTSSGISIDRWYARAYQGSLSLVSGGLKFQDSTVRVYQNLDDDITKQLVGKQVTFSAIVSEIAGMAVQLYIGNNAEEWNIVESTSAAGLVSGTFIVPADFTSLTLMVQTAYSESDSDSATVLAVKLELGAQQTLAHQDDAGNWILHSMADFYEELAKARVEPNSVAIKHGTAAVAELRKTDTGRGVMALRSAAHSDWAAIQAYALPEGGGGLITKNAAGNTIFTLSASISGMQEDAGGIVVGNADGTGRALIGVNTAGGGILQLRDAAGNAAILTKERIDQIGAAANGVEVKNGDTTVAYLNQTEDGRGNFQLRKADGTLGVHAYVNGGSGGEIDLRNGSGARRAAFYVSGDDEGCLQLIDADGVAQKLTPARLAVWPSNPNLLDNWFFPNAVNQGGVTSWTIENDRLFDRWRLGYYRTGPKSISLTATPGSGLTLVCTDTEDDAYIEAVQDIESAVSGYLVGKEVTLSVLTNRGLFTKTATPASDSYYYVVFENFTAYLCVRTGDTGDVRLRLHTGSSSITIYAAKLELGAQQTLAHQNASGAWVLNTVPDYDEELIKCRRYYRRSWTGSISAAGMVGFVKSSVGNSQPVVSWDSPMRTTPVITIRDLSATANSINDWATDESIAITGTSWVSPYGFSLNGVSGLTAGRCYGFHYEADANL